MSFDLDRLTHEDSWIRDQRMDVLRVSVPQASAAAP